MQRLKILLQSKTFILISIIFLVLYVFLFTKIIRYDSIYSEGGNVVEGIIIDYKIDGDKLSITINSKEKLLVNYYFKTLQEKNIASKKIKLGSKIKVEGVINSPTNNTIPNTFNYKKYLYNKKIYRIINASNIEFLNNNISLKYWIKNQIIKRANSFSYSKSYMYAFVLGKNGYIDSNIYDIYRSNGITHLFAVSGMHVGFLILCLNIFLTKLKIKENYIEKLIIIFLLFYMFLIGYTASVVRASLLYIALLLNKKSKINLDNKLILYLVMFSLLIINPFYICDLGFQYSFVTSFGLMLFSKKITGNYLQKTLRVSVVAFLFSMPITLYNFYEINLLTILNNIIIVPLVSLILFPLALLTFILPFLESILNMGLLVLENINLFLNNMEINFILAKVNFIFILIYYSILYLIYKYNIKYILLLVLLLVVYKIIPYLDSSSYVYYLDVGQGDCSLVVTENKKDIIMIDTGGKIEYEKEGWQKRNSSYNLSDNIIVFLKSLGIDHIDILIGTHGDFDHMGEAINLVNNFEVENVIFNNDNFNKLENELIKLLDKKKINHYNRLENLNSHNIKLYFLNTRIYDNENDNSNVIYFKLDSYKFLFMGDVGVDRENEILDKYKLGVIDFLKVGHHGSNTSSSEYFINSIKPRKCIIQVGKNNRYGHPKDSVLDTLDDYCNIYRTDLNGSIEIKINKNNYKIRTMN